MIEDLMMANNHADKELKMLRRRLQISERSEMPSLKQSIPLLEEEIKIWEVVKLALENLEKDLV